MKELTAHATNRQQSGQIRRLTSLLKKYQLAYAVQQALLKLSELASTLTDMAQFYPQIHQLVNQHLAADNFFVVLLDPPTGRFQLEYYADEKDCLDDSDLDPADFARGMTGYVCRTGQPLLCDAEKFRQLIAAGDIEAQGTPSHHWLGVPLRRGQLVIGVMAVQLYEEGRLYTQHDVDLLTEIAVHTVTAIDRVKSRELL